MKIVILGTAYPLRGGIAHYNALLAHHLGKKHHVEIITFKRQYPSFLFPGKTQQETSDPGIVMPSEQLMDSVNPFNWIRVGFKLRARRPDVVVFKYWLPFFGPCFGTICRLIKWKRATKVIAICDNVIPHEQRPGDRVFTRYAFGSVDAFIVQSGAVEKDLLATVAEPRYRKVAHPVYEIFGDSISKEEARRRLQVSDRNVLLFFGYIRPYKGLHLFIDALKLVKQKISVKALVVGEFYEDEQPYRRHLRQVGVEDVVQLVADYVPNDKVAEYFCAADVVVLPYLSATQSGIAQIAYNFNKPVIATDVGGLAEVVLDGISGLIVPPNDPQALADAMVKFYTQRMEEKLSAGVQEEKKKYPWNAMVETIESLAILEDRNVQYDPIKKVFGNIVHKHYWLRRLFYTVLGLMFLREWYVKRELRNLLHNRSGPIDIYDAGSGFGQYSYYVAKRLPSAHIYAVDVKEEQVADCQQFFEAVGLRQCSFAIENLLTIQHTNRFDLILSVDVMEHIEDDMRVFGNFFRALKPDGLLLVNTPSNLGGSDVHAEGEKSFIEEHARSGYGVEEIRTKLVSAGFTIARLMFTYGPLGSAAWRLGIKYPMQMLNASKLFFVLLPIYYLVVLPLVLPMMYIDYISDNKTGTGLLVIAQKP